MAELYESVRERQSNIIEQNKASIIISRTTNVDDGAGGWVPSISTLPVQDFRIYNKKTRVLDINTGGWHSQRVILMIAKWDADVEAKNETFTDTFNYGGKDYEIFDVKDIYTQGFICFKECQISEVS
jgi:hypothetical protein